MWTIFCSAASMGIIQHTNFDVPTYLHGKQGVRSAAQEAEKPTSGKSFFS